MCPHLKSIKKQKTNDKISEILEKGEKEETAERNKISK